MAEEKSLQELETLAERLFFMSPHSGASSAVLEDTKSRVEELIEPLSSSDQARLWTTFVIKYVPERVPEILRG